MIFLITILFIVLIFISAAVLWFKIKKKLALIPILFLALIIAFGLVLTQQSQRVLFKTEISENVYVDDERSRISLSLVLPNDEDIILLFESDLQNLLGEKLAERFSWTDDWFDYEITPQNPNYKLQYDYIPVTIFNYHGKRLFLQSLTGIIVGDINVEDKKKALQTKVYTIVINNKGDISDPEDQLKDLKKELDQLIDIHFSREYKKNIYDNVQ